MRFVFSVLAVLILVGCTATGPKFSDHNAGLKPEPGKALVYVYRLDQFRGVGVTSPFLDNGKQVGILNAGGYITFQTDPGEHEFRTDVHVVDEAMLLDVVEGQTYYLKIFTQGVWRMVFNTVLVPEEKAVIELKEMRYQGD
ncbi:MAG: hypothetical protein CMN55_10630 [Sneathiella sp.]|jgi:hypothetical protein|uniref:DUF2846 domain-containing protein n=1 Tax=Sneathiella sp. TaxID=1964365 RepID=UPI000C38FE05|nr:DUF2846 domain-containing protein [Sneathiella sp.]MAL79548.1 hypothetical protein [Sneathiella sp.]|tara:strand:- start:277 stop:699 length:423 start_codon:yes stop_codon:yes gene_type:complete